MVIVVEQKILATTKQMESTIIKEMNRLDADPYKNLKVLLLKFSKVQIFELSMIEWSKKAST